MFLILSRFFPKISGLFIPQIQVRIKMTRIGHFVIIKTLKKKKDNLSKICESILILFSGKKIHLEQYTVHCNRNEYHTISFKNT